MNPHTKWLPVVLFVCSMTTVNIAQSETVPEAISRGATGRIRTPPSGKPPAIADILADTELAVRGVVSDPQSYLSEDQMDVYTEYILATLRFCIQRNRFKLHRLVRYLS